MKLSFLFSFLVFIPLSAAGEEYFYPLPGASNAEMSKVKVRGRDGMVFIYEKPFAVVSTQEVSGNPQFYWLTADIFLYKGCQPDAVNPHQCDTLWSVGRVLDQKSVRVTSLKHIEGITPIFNGPFVAYQNLLPNGNLGCFVYDTEKKRYLAEKDTKYKLPADRRSYAGAPELDLAKREVTCRSLEDWEQYQIEDGLGSSVQYKPKAKKEFRVKLQ